MKGHDRELGQVTNHVTKGAERRLRQVLREETHPDPDPGRWLLRVVKAMDPLYGDPRPRAGREDRYLELADTWVDIASLAMTAAVSAALLGYEDRLEELEDKIFNRIQRGMNGYRMETVNTASPLQAKDDEVEVPF